MPSKEAKRLADTDLADLADYVPKRMRMTPAAAMCAGTGDNAVGQMAEIRHVLVSTKGILTEASEDPEHKLAFNCFHHAVEKDKEHSEVPFCRLFVHVMQTRS